ncbi:tetratricopeptide repeat protein 31-like [Scleropages formosus]|uniref:Tetratricopeptide repeat protein 31-like n=1 Tax=Scleropages formosus TaxID=113540 RepID=A0A8C9QZT5_SCLFO|nr:tetratricopeptide repeat protein 31-like [Scleropages formosus]
MADRRNNEFGVHDPLDVYHMRHLFESMYLPVDPLQNALFGLDFSHSYYDDSNYTDDDSDEDDHSSRKPYCGFSRNFLEPKQLPFPGVSGRPRLKEEADRNAKELIEQEEKLKEKAEKKRLKKLRQKERKRLEKMKNKYDVTDMPECSEPELTKSTKPNTSSSKVNVKAGQSNEEGCREPPDSRSPPPKSNGASHQDKDVSEPEEESEEESIVSEPEELDMASCFVSKAAAIAKRKQETKPKPVKKKNPAKQQNSLQQNGAESSTGDVVTKSIELAVIGNKLASIGEYSTAVMYFTDAIKYNPKEHRLFGNRSFCYEKMQEYEKSLADAELSLTMCPNWIKGLYRKGKALAGLKRYSEAAMAFKEVLHLDTSSNDAAQELMTVQIMQLMEMGFSREQSTNALIIHGNVEKALEVLSSIQDTTFVNTSKPVEEEWVVLGKKAPKASSVVKSTPSKAPKQVELFPIWVGNLIPSISEKMIQDVFSFAGEIHSIKLLSSRRCAFVNYTKKQYCEKAIKELHATQLQGTKLSVRYPDRIYTHLGTSRAAVTAADSGQKSGECFYWRNGACSKEERCIYKHIPEHKGIDRVKDKASS